MRSVDKYHIKLMNTKAWGMEKGLECFQVLGTGNIITVDRNTKKHSEIYVGQPLPEIGEYNTEISKRRRGDISEARAAAWLLEQGYLVGLACGADGPIDMVAIDGNTGEHILVDVKGTPARRTKIQSGLGVRILWVDHDIKWVKGD